MFPQLLESMCEKKVECTKGFVLQIQQGVTQVAHARKQSGSKYHASQSSPLRPPVFMLAASVGPRSTWKRLWSGRRAVEERRRCSCAPSASRALMEANKCGRTPKDSSMCTWPDGNVYVGEIHNTARCTARESFLGRASCRLGTPT